jgi:starch synthase
MDVLMVAAELGPYARATEAGDAIPSLAKALRQLGHRVTVALPRYGAFEAHGLFAARRLTPLAVAGGEVNVYDGQLSSGVELVLFDLPGLSEPAGLGLESVKDAAVLESYLALGRAAAGLARQRREQGTLDVIHAHDWPGALVAAYLDERSPPLVLSSYDVQRPGWIAPAASASLDDTLRARLLHDERPSALGAGIRAARVVVTTSVASASEALDARASGPLAAQLAALAEPLVGVASGLDYATYNPAIDPALEARFDAEDPWTKARTKGAILRHLRLDLEIQRPLVLFAGPLAKDSGADVLLAALPALGRSDFSLVVAGEGDAELAAGFRAARDQRPEAIAYIDRIDDNQRRRLYAASDIALIARRRASAETSQLVAQRYGAVPVALAAGAVVDTVVDADATLETGTGFLFDRPEPADLVAALERALSAYASEDNWARLRRRVMRLDLGWDRPARRYAQVYRRALELASG